MKKIKSMFSFLSKLFRDRLFLITGMIVFIVIGNIALYIFDAPLNFNIFFANILLASIMFALYLIFSDSDDTMKSDDMVKSESEVNEINHCEIIEIEIDDDNCRVKITTK